jgi:excisionase family DNA binding protein
MTATSRLTPAEPVLSAAEIADALGVSRRWVYAMVEEHDLPAYKIGRSLAFEMSAVQGWLAARRIGAWHEPCGNPGPADFISDNMQRAPDG